MDNVTLLMRSESGATMKSLSEEELNAERPVKDRDVLEEAALNKRDAKASRPNGPERSSFYFFFSCSWKSS